MLGKALSIAYLPIFLFFPSLPFFLLFPFSFSDGIPPRYRCNPAKMGYSAEFQKHLSVNKKDFSTVEYLLRKGNRQLELYSSPGIRNIR